MKKKNNGFTLVELLAVIVILAIIMILSIPSVLDTVTTSRKRSFSTYAKKVVLATEQTNTAEEMAQNITGRGIYTYSIKDDIGLSGTGSYDGYVVVDDCTESEKQYYVYLEDGSFMVYDFHDKDNAEVLNSDKFGDYEEDEWKSAAGSKEAAAASVVNITGGYTCSIYGKNSSEILGSGGTEIPGLPTSSSSAVLLAGPYFNLKMLEEVGGVTSFHIINNGYGRPIVYPKETGSGKTIDEIADTTIKALERSKTITEDQKASAVIVSADDSPNPVYMWKDGSTIYWYTDAKKVYVNSNADYMFAWLGGITSLDLSQFDFSQTTSMEFTFAGEKGMTSIDLSSVNTVNVTSLVETFVCMTSLKSIDISMWNISKVTDVTWLFGDLESATSIKFPKNLVNSKTTRIAGMFADCSNVTSLDVGFFDTRNVTDMDGVFEGCKKVTYLDVSNWNTSKVTNMSFVFYNANALKTVDLKNWDVSNADTLEGMFFQCNALTVIDLSTWHVKSGIKTSGMFNRLANLKTIYTSESWKDKISEGTYMFSGSTKLVGGNGTKYSNSYQSAERTYIDGENGQKGYFTKKETATMTR